MPFFNFRQNNSGGYFHEPAIDVIIEAPSPDDANNVAEDIGLYFNGCNDGRDCSCCGDRWYAQWDDDKGDEVPSVYGEPVDRTNVGSIVGNDGQPDALIIYADGRRETIARAEPPTKGASWQQ